MMRVVPRRAGLRRSSPFAAQNEAADVAAVRGDLRDLVEELHRAGFGQEAGREGEIARVHGKGRRDDAEDELVGGLLERAPAAGGQPAERQPAATPGLAQGKRRRPALLLGEAEVEASERAV